MKQLLLALGVVLLMTGCGSAVKLDPVPVVDKSGTSISTNSAGGGVGSGVGAGGVNSTDISQSGQQGIGPAGPRIVYFDYDRFSIKPEFQAVISAHARFITADRTRKVAIEGHTDERGGREYNLALGQKRAEAVRNALSLLGVSDSQIEAVSFGKEKPAVSGDDENALAQNRRAEITYR
jgi:peptidoglycan-associated lipoprotein